MANSTQRLLTLLHNVACQHENRTEQLFRLLFCVQQLLYKSANRVPYAANFIEQLQPNEPKTSGFIRSILSYEDTDGRYTLLENFITTFLQDKGLSCDKVSSPEITAEKDHIDVLVCDDTYAILFENKVKGAKYQPNQLGRYIRKLSDKPYNYLPEQIFIILLPEEISQTDYVDQLQQSVWRFPLDNSHCHFRCDFNEGTFDHTQADNKYCEQCISYKTEYKSRTIVLQNDFADWINKEAKLLPSEEPILKAAMILFSDYLKGIYKTQISDKLMQKMKNLIKQELLKDIKDPLGQYDALDRSVNDLNEIIDQVVELKKELSRQLVDTWRDTLRKEGFELDSVEGKEFYIKLKNGLLAGCWLDDDGSLPYWGLWNPTGEKTKKQIKETQAILKACDIDPDNLPDNPYYTYWAYTRQGDNRCRKLFETIAELGLVDQNKNNASAEE